MLEVSVSGYYAWLRRQQSPSKSKKIVSPETTLSSIKLIRASLGYTPGYRQARALLRQRGIHISEKRLRSILRTNGIVGYRHHRRVVKTTDSNHNMYVYPNLLARNFSPGMLNRAWVSDITYLPIPEGKWAYLCTITDLGSRRVLGWAIDTNMETQLVLKAFDMAVKARGKAAVAGTIMHSDRGTQYCSAAFQKRLHDLDMRPSMSEVGQCWDNAPGESIWSSLKRETLIGRKQFDSFENAVAKVTHWINIYNTIRPHSAIGMQSPVAYETLIARSKEASH